MRLLKQGATMIRRALLAVVFLAVAASPVVANAQPFHMPLEIWIDSDWTAFLYNTTGAPISFDGYQIATEDGKLDPAGWKSISDYVADGAITDVIAALGPGGLTFGEANPGPGNLAELNLGGVGTLQGGAKFSIGKPFGDGGYLVSFFYKIGGSPSGTPGDTFFVPPRIPEPSTFLLAALAGLGLMAFRRRAS
jgi:hypothetical protein